MKAITSFYFDGFIGVGAWIILLVIGTAFASWVAALSDTRQQQARSWVFAAFAPLLILIVSGILDLYDAIAASFSTTQWSGADILAVLGLAGVGITVFVTLFYIFIQQGNPPLVQTPIPNPPGNDVHQPLPRPSQIYFEDKTIIELENVQREAVTQIEALPSIASLVSHATSYPITEGTNTIGRSERQNSVIIDDPFVSRWHAVIWAAEERFVIADWASAKGTFVNGKAVGASGQELHLNDIVKLGQTEFRFMVHH